MASQFPLAPSSIRWTPPPQNIVKVNFDGSVLQHDSSAAVGFIFRDCSGCPFFASARKLGKANVPIAEATALRDSLLKAKKLNYSHLMVEGDSALIINCVTERLKCPWKLLQIVQDIKKIASSFSLVSFHHVLREANFTANALANLGQNLDTQHCWESNLLSSVRVTVNFDLFGGGCLRDVRMVDALQVSFGGAMKEYKSTHLLKVYSSSTSSRPNIKWPPPSGQVKINFDDSVIQQSSDVAAGFIIRDEVGCLLVASARKIVKTTILIAEATALRDSLLFMLWGFKIS
ncbi:hypothetical protein ACLB2K_044565 [Fragaria x ananassa]